MGEHSVFSSDETGGFEARDLLRAVSHRCLFFGLRNRMVDTYALRNPRNKDNNLLQINKI